MHSILASRSSSLLSRMRIRSAVMLLALALTAMPASGQIIRPGSGFQSQTWMTVGLGVLQTQVVEDWATTTEWDFGTVWQWRGSLERTLRNGGSVGLAGALARPSLAYDGVGCAPCEASANLFQVLAAFRIGGGPGFHQVIELHAGVTGFSNFRRDTDDARLEPNETVIDPTFSIGFGFGYGLGQSTQLAIVQEYGAMLHRNDSAPSGANTLRQLRSTRISLRIGLGR